MKGLRRLVPANSLTRLAFLTAVLTWISLLLWTPALEAAEKEDRFGPIDWAESMPLADKSLLLDVVEEGGRMVAVGERGHVLLSTDGDSEWRQAQVPTRSMLNAATALKGGLFWAVGHDAVIVHSADGGENWTRQYYAPDEQSPLLDVWFENARHGIAVGAYALFLETVDGGATWERRYVDDEERHWNAVTESPDGTLFVAAEFGAVFRSRDKGKNWDVLATPYEGTFFSALTLSDGTLLVYGLRGNIYRTVDQGETWQHIKTETTASLLNGLQCRDGSVVIVGLSGTILLSRDNGNRFTSANRPDRMAIASAVELGSKGLLLSGEGGTSRDENFF